MTDTELKNELDALKKNQADAAAELAKGNKEAFDKAMEAYDIRFAKLETDIKTAALSVPGNGQQENPQAKAYKDYLFTGAVNLEHLKLANPQNSLTGTPDTNGGILIPKTGIQKIIEYSQDGNPMRELADIQTISVGDTYRAADEYGTFGGGWVGERATRSETTTQSYGELQIPLREMYAEPKISNILLSDAEFDIEGRINRQIGRKFAALENAAFFNGAGPDQPTGIMTYTMVADASWERGKFGYIAAGSTSALSGDGIISLVDSLKDQYQGNAKFVMKQATWTAIRQLKVGTSAANMYLLWTPDIVNGQLQNLLLGHPVKLATQMPAVASGAYPIAFGDFRQAYTIVDKMVMAMIRDIYTSKGFTIFYSTKRTGGGATNTEAVKFLKMVS